MTDPYTAGLQKLLRRRSDGRYELLVVLKRDTDYEDYESRIASLEGQIDSLKQQVYRFSMMANEYISAYDEIRRLKRLLQDHDIPF